ncbi:hypothetical protein QL285_052697 [Trifolium repens]|nr:hypothetical protein QL285_052697 [Trifolium repens]
MFEVIQEIGALGINKLSLEGTSSVSGHSAPWKGVGLATKHITNIVKNLGAVASGDDHDGDGQEGYPRKNLCIASVGFIKELEKVKMARI